MASQKEKGILKIDGNGLSIDGKYLPMITEFNLSQKAGGLINLNLNLIVNEITVNEEFITEINEVKIPESENEIVAKAIIDELVNINLIDHSRL